MNRSLRPYIVQGFIALGILGAGIVAYLYYTGDAETPKRKARFDKGILVEVMTVRSSDHLITLEATGTVEAARRMNLKSESSGRITYVNGKYHPGAHLKKGDVVAKISTKDYEIKLAQAKITLSQREAALVQEKAKGRAAEAELKALQENILRGKALGKGEEALIRREPQLQEALAGVELARTQVAQADLDYERSVVRMPYDAVLETAPISWGDYIGGGTSLGSIVADDQVYIRVSLAPSMIAWTGASPEALSKIVADVSYEMGAGEVTRSARVLSMLGEVEALGRMVQLVLVVDDPFGPPLDAPLLTGTFVHVKLHTPSALKSIELDRAHVREGNQVYVCDENDKLDIRTIVTPYKTEKRVYVTEGLADGDRVVTTLISSPIKGRKLRVKGEVGEKPEDARESPEERRRIAPVGAIDDAAARIGKADSARPTPKE